MTQGPFASISAAPGSIMRVYGMFYDEKVPSKNWMQTSKHNICMTEGLSKYYTVRNGYIVNDGTEIDMRWEKIDELVGRARVGVQQDVDVVFGRRKDGLMEVLFPRHRISQVFCAGMNLQQGSSGQHNAMLGCCEEKATLMLRSAYMGAYLTAITLKCSKLFLTLVGGGVFGNPISKILNEIIYAHRCIALSPLNTSIKEVHLSIYSRGAGVLDKLFNLLRDNGIKFMSNEGLREPFIPQELPPFIPFNPVVQQEPRDLATGIDSIKQSVFSTFSKVFRRF